MAAMKIGDPCKLCGGKTEVFTTPYARYLDCISCGERWNIKPEREFIGIDAPQIEAEDPERDPEQEDLAARADFQETRWNEIAAAEDLGRGGE